MTFSIYENVNINYFNNNPYSYSKNKNLPGYRFLCDLQIATEYGNVTLLVHDSAIE